ncbi:cysteine hydrolase family protein [Microbacter sp. GSS18]|nr:cysteine hydrolase family protein [Microbacter sp. GSS18]
MQRALIVIDMQRGFDDESVWGRLSNPACEQNVRALLESFSGAGEPIVVVRHDSLEPGFGLSPGEPGNALVDTVAEIEPAVLVTKHVNSAFYGDPDLHAWLRDRGIRELVLCGIQTDMCVETTARMAGNLGYDVTVAIDATRTFDLSAEVPGIGTVSRSAEDLMATTALQLQEGDFARISATSDLI